MHLCWMSKVKTYFQLEVLIIFGFYLLHAPQREQKAAYYAYVSPRKEKQCDMIIQCFQVSSLKTDWFDAVWGGLGWCDTHEIENLFGEMSCKSYRQLRSVAFLNILLYPLSWAKAVAQTITCDLRHVACVIRLRQNKKDSRSQCRLTALLLPRTARVVFCFVLVYETHKYVGESFFQDRCVWTRLSFIFIVFTKNRSG